MSCTTRGLPCRPVTRIRGGLLLHHFTLTCALRPSAVSFCCTICPGSSRYPSPTFMRRVALRCPDFPQRELAPRCDRPGDGLRVSAQKPNGGKKKKQKDSLPPYEPSLQDANRYPRHQPGVSPAGWYEVSRWDGNAMISDEYLRNLQSQRDVPYQPGASPLDNPISSPCPVGTPHASRLRHSFLSPPKTHPQKTTRSSAHR